MEKQSSIELLRSLESQVETQLNALICTFQNLQAEVLTRQAPNGGWSIAQCLWHLNSYGHHYLPAITKGMAKGYPASDIFTSTWMGARFTNLMKPGKNMTKMKAFKNHRPPSNIDPHLAVAEFIQQQETLLGLLRKAHQTDLSKVKVPISILPWMNMRLGDVFQFLIAHIDRHLQQAGRNINS
ncbi:MAG: DinB family protein [Cyclobacteriaceae bacterium]|nr:DinB family protein [Cyclobacteriaceae bacterium]